MKVVTSFTIIADMARNVAGDAAIVESITKAGAEIHDYQPTPRDILRARGADLILWNGLNLERWFERFMRDMDNAQSIVISDGITPLSIYQGPYSGKPNPHAWMSTTNALIYVENIRAAFAAADPANAVTYNKNAAAYSQKIKTLRARLHARIAKIPSNKRILVTSEGAFTYLTHDMGFQEYFLWPINADQQGSPQQVKAVIDIMRQKDIPAIFSESTISDKPARQVANETRAVYGGVLYVDSLSQADGPVPTYLDLLQTTTDTIIAGIQKGMKSHAK
ncbi:MAG: metal ABC transporter substrate-binding protein [Pseudomonadota bacterium]